MTAALVELRDRAAIHAVLLRYAHGVDARDLTLVSSCFTPDAAYEGTLGRGTVQDALASLARALERYTHTMHFLGNHLIEVAGDTAASETYAIAYHRVAGDDARTFTTGVRYLDTLARRGDGWIICARVARMEWQRYDTAAWPPV